MTKKELSVILNSIRNAQNNIEVLGFENYPYGMAEDEDIRKMYYELNDMCILLNKKIKRARK
jgi:hypothetical protein